MRKLIFAILSICALQMAARNTYNFNSGWIMGNGQKVTLPHAWNEDEAFKVRIAKMSDSVVWYKKQFKFPIKLNGQHVFIEFEGARQVAEVWLNGHRLGMNENGVMAFGFELTPYIKKGFNLIEVRTDNDWHYKSRINNTPFQWNNNNFNANYGGLTKNVYLHICPQVFQTLPLYSSLGTTGVYVYASDFDIQSHTATIHAECQVKNASSKLQHVSYKVNVEEMDGHLLHSITGGSIDIPSDSTMDLKVSDKVNGLHFWSWGYGYLYKIKTIVNNDTVTTITGFRKTKFRDGYVRLNDRAMLVHGYAQRTSNEWPGLGMSVPAWMSDYSNGLMVKGGANLVRWMHVTPWKQDVESCDRVGLLEAMPAGDAESDVSGTQWRQRVDLMRDAIIYNRNNPSIIFYECGNKGISKEHYAEMKAVRDSFDINGGRAIGCREMLNIPESEYGGEMLYVNKSDSHPVWAMEYCRDEGLRKYWNSWSYPYHKEGAGPLYRGADASAYNHNQDEFAAEMVRRWFDFWEQRPGTGTKVSGGGVKIVFSDTQTHCRGAENYRRSGVVDAMRIPKDGYFANQVMWSGWVDDCIPHTYICGHWNYHAGDTIPRIYVISNSDSVRLLINGNPIYSKQKNRLFNYLYCYEHVLYTPGQSTAISYGKNGQEESRYSIETAGETESLRLSVINSPSGWKADGADVVLVQVEAIDKQGRRCPLDNRIVKFNISGPAQWRGGIAQAQDDKNYVLSKTLPLECGINRIILRSLCNSGKIELTATSDGLPSASITLHSIPFNSKYGISNVMPFEGLPNHFERGETPQKPSFISTGVDVPIRSVTAGANSSEANKSIDGDETTSWSSDGKLEKAWIDYTFQDSASIKEICLKMSDFRSKSYPIAIYADNDLIWKGTTPKSLGYVRLKIEGKHVQKALHCSIHLIGAINNKDAFNGIKELDARNDEQTKNNHNILKIIEVQFIKSPSE